MQRDEVIEFLAKIDHHIGINLKSIRAGETLELRIIGKSALLLAGLTDSIGTVDVDALSIEGRFPGGPEIKKELLDQFGRSKLKVNGYYLEFVDAAMVFLSQTPHWVMVPREFSNLSVYYLEPHHVIASKCFSAFANPPRKKDKQDVIAALDQGLVTFQRTLDIAEEIFDLHSMDARSDRFPEVYEYITGELMKEFGQGNLKYRPELE